MNFETSMILSIPQIRLCMRVLGLDLWDDLPLLLTEEPPEQRIMNGFLELITMGLMIPDEGKYRMDSVLREQMERIGGAQKTYQLSDAHRIQAFLYETDSSLVLLSPDWGKPGYCRISSFSGISPEQICEEYASSRACSLTMQLQDTTNQEPGQYDMEKLACFFGMNEKPEDKT